MAGQPYVGLARCTVAAKSPLTGGVGETRCDGPFAAALKGSGADTLIFHGAAERPVLVLIEDSQVSFNDAAPLWGLPVSQTVDLLEARFGQAIHTAVIGPAGERLVRFASIVSDRAYQAPRMGLGAVMGSKRIKAVVIRGESFPPVANPDRCADITKLYQQRMMENPLTRWQYEPPGFSAWVHTHGTDAALCTHNFRDSVFAGADEYRPSVYMKFYRHDGICPGCPNHCFKFFGSGDDVHYDPRAGAMHQEITGTLGPNLGIADVEFIVKANILCNELGLDPTSLGFSLSFAMECLDNGALDEVTVGLPLRFGNANAALQMISQIARREGFGDTLAEGVKRAADRIGGHASRFAMHVKGLELAVFEPRTQTNLALGYATAAIGPRFDICEHDWDYDTETGWPHTMDGSLTLGILERVPMAELSDRKVKNYKVLNTIWSGCDVLDLNVYVAAPTRALRLGEMAELLGAITGWDTSSFELMKLGERRNHLMRIYNLREGLTADDDTLPNRFFDEPISQGKWAGTRLDRDAFRARITTYYRMMGWDDAGFPRFETLLDHDLDWTIREGHITRRNEVTTSRAETHTLRERDVTRIKIGLTLHPQHATASDYVRAWQYADQLGVDSIWNWDQFLPLRRPQRSHIRGLDRLGRMRHAHSSGPNRESCLSIAYRNPALLSAMARTLDHLIGGRLVLGIGAGWFERDYEEYGFEFGTAAQRLRELESGVEIIKRRWLQDEPRPLRGTIPILIGGSGEKVTLRIVAQHADLWHSFGSPTEWSRKNQILDNWCVRTERPKEAIERIASIADESSQAPVRDMQSHYDMLEAYVAAGADHILYGLGAPFNFEPIEALLRWREQPSNRPVTDFVRNVNVLRACCKTRRSHENQLDPRNESITYATACFASRSACGRTNLGSEAQAKP